MEKQGRIPFVRAENNTYIFQLIGGQSWAMAAASSGVKEWFGDFISVLGLREGPAAGSRNIIFTESAGVEDLTRNPAWRMKHDFKLLRFWQNGSSEDVICELSGHHTHNEAIMCMWLGLHPFYSQALGKGALPMHAALVEKNGKGFLLAGPGGIGKSTCSRRIPRPWKALCDDEAVILPGEDGGYMAHPFPTWTDHLWRNSKKRWDTQRGVPLSAIFFLDQAPDDGVSALDEAAAAALIFNSASQIWKRFDPRVKNEESVSFKKVLLENACRLAKRIRCFILRVSLNGEFWDKMEAAVKDA